MELEVGISPETVGVAMEFPVFDGAELSSPPTVPPRLRRRLTETKVSSSPSSIEEIEAKLRSADLRRQKFYENLSSKARPKRRSPQSADESNLARRLEAKLQAAEQKRMQIFKAHSQRRATLREKASQSLLRTIAIQSKYKECVNAAIYQKRSVAEKNKLGLLESENTKANARLLQVKKVAKSISQYQKIKSESLEDKLQKTKRQRANRIMQKESLQKFSEVNSNNNTQKQAEYLSRNLLRCWRKFLKQKTTLHLAVSYHALNINASQIKSMPFDHFALLMETPSTLRTTKSFLDRLETRYKVLLNVSSQTNFNGQDDINHLLTRVVSQNRGNSVHVKISRYQPRVVLSAYMILGHPDAVFSGQGARETALASSAEKFVQEFELLIDILLNRPSLAKGCTFRSPLAIFDAAWCSYLNSFVVWRVKDVESLEKDLIKAACQMETSMMRKYKPTCEKEDTALTHDVKSFQKQMQVTEHQKLLMEKILHLSGEAGIKRLQNALSEIRRNYLESNEKNSKPAKSAVEKSKSVVRLISDDNAATSSPENIPSDVASGSDLVNQSRETLGIENVFIVNEFLHGRDYSFSDSLNITDENQKVRKTMEKAFWDGVYDSIQHENYDHVILLMKEVRDELCEISPQKSKHEIMEVIDLDILSQLLSSRSLDMDYLGKIMEFALANLQKLSALANENKLKESHRNILSELAELCQAGDGSNRSHAIALIKGLRFVLEQIQALKQEISKARIKIMEPLLKGPTGLEYLRKAFEKLYGPPSDALIRLPLTIQWLSSVVSIKDHEWSEHKRVLLELQESSYPEIPLLPSTTLKTGGSFSTRVHTSATFVDITGADNKYTECKGEKGDLLIRLGLIKLVNDIDGVTQEELPETLKLNFMRLRAVQGQIQKITVVATSILILRQTLVMEQMITNTDNMETTILKCSSDLFRILDTIPSAGLDELISVLSKTIESFNKVNELTKSQSRRVVMARMLTKSVQAGDPVFVKVSRAVYLAVRGVVLGGGGGGGREVAEMVLRQVGAAALTEKVVEMGKVLAVISRVSGNVHGLWYDRLIENL